MEYKVPGLYLLFGLAWIILSDRLLATLVNDPAAITELQTYKGWAFVILSTILIFFLLRSYLANQRKDHEYIMEQEEKYRLLFDNSLDAIILSSLDGEILAANRSACQIFRKSEEELVGSTRDTVVDMSDPRISAGLEERSRTGRFSGEWTFIRKNGQKFPGEISLALYKDGSGRDRSGIIIRDVTERKLAESALQDREMQLRKLNNALEQRVAERTAELQAALEKVRETDRLKSVFLTTMSHELRTPLNSIIGFTGVLAQGLAGPINEEQTKQLGMIRQSSRHLLNLINDVLDLSRIEAGQLTVSPSYFDLRLAIDEVFRITMPSAQAKNLGLSVSMDPHIGMIYSDKRRVEQVLINLVNNAIKFTEKGEIKVTCSTSGDQLLIAVSDTGIGIDQASITDIFNPFHQVDMGLNRRHEGSGLGLSISKNLMILLGGDIQVQSEPGKGSTFQITIPVHP
jgi:PAS domain S-box-containing protein